MRSSRAAALVLLLVAASLGGQSPGAGRPREAMFLSLVSGDYRDDQALRAEPLQDGLVIRYSFRTAGGGEGPWMRCRAPIPLTAAPGEEREYRVILVAESGGREVERRTVDVRIDRRRPAAPLPVPGPGRFWEPVAVRFEENPGERVFWGFGDAAFSKPRRWDGNPVVIGRAGVLERTVLRAWREDAAGNRSAVAAHAYAIDARPATLELQSPAQGTYANPQLLAVAFRNVAWIRYSTDGSDPAAGGTPYAGPVTITRRGEVQVRVAAAPRSGAEVIRREVRYTYQPEQGAGIVVTPASGIVRGPVNVRVVSAPTGVVYAALGEKTPFEWDMPVDDGFALDPASGPRTVVLRFRCRAPDGTWGAEYRLVHVLAGPPPGAPDVATPRTSLRVPSAVGIDAAEDVLVFATLDGTTPTAASATVNGAVPVSPAAASRSRVLLRVACMDATGTFSAVRDAEIPCDTTPGNVPVLVAAAAAPGNVEVRADLASDPGLAVVYEIASPDREAPVPTADSPQLPRPLVLTVPFGMERTFSVRCATLDDAGQVVGVGDPVVLALDRAPPPPPIVVPGPDPLGFDAPLTVSVESSALVRYSMTEDGTSPPDPTAASATAVGGIPLPGRPGGRAEYRFKLIALDALGNASEVYGPFVYVVDLGAPELPEIGGIEQNGTYGARRISPRLGPGTAQVRYTATSDGSVPPDPGPDSAQFGPQTVFTAEPGEERRWRVKLLALSRSGALRGETRELSFLMDLRPPEVPGFSGFVERGRYAAPVVAAADAVPPETMLYLTWSESPQEPADPVAAGARYTGPVTFDTADGTTKTFIVRAASRDLSGNRSLYDRYYRFTVDREPPPDPEILDVPASGVAAGPVTVSLAFSEGTARYEVTDDGSPPRLPDESSPRYESPFLLSGRPGDVVRYQVATRAMDDLGNASAGSRVERVTIDRTVPQAPPPPRLAFSDAADAAWLLWDPPASGRILFRTRAGAAYTAYTGPVPIGVKSLSGGVVTGDAVAENEAGTRSDPTPFRLAAARPLARPVVAGLRDGAVVARRVELSAAAPSGELRYEIRSDGGYPPTVTASSPIAGPSMSLDVTAGETRSFTVAYRAFDPTGTAPPSESALVSFTIDRTPPDPPVLQGMEAGAFADSARTVTLVAAEGAIYYSLSADGRDPPIPPMTEAARYRGPITLAASAGKSITYRILAFTADPAGNRSRAMLAWSATIDQATVYAAPDGNDAWGGTRAEPVRSLAWAVDLAGRTGRLVVCLATGEYPVDAGIRLNQGMTVLGGLDRGTWAAAGLGRRSVLAPSAYFRTQGTLLSAAAGAVTLSGIELRDGAGKAATLLSLAGTALAARDVAMLVQGEGTRTALSASASSVTISESSFTAEKAGTTTLATVSGGTMTITGCTFSGPPQAADFACLAATADARIVVAGSTFEPGSGLKVRGIRAVGSSVTLENTRLSSGAGRLEAAAVDLRGGAFLARNCDFSASVEAAAPACLIADGSSVAIESSRMQVSGQTGAAGVSVSGGELSMRDSMIHGGTTAEYLYLVYSVKADVGISGSILAGGQTGDLAAILARDSRIEVRASTIAAGPGRLATTAIAAHGSGTLSVSATVLAALQPGVGPAVLVRTPQRGLPEGLEILSCCFGGWDRLIGFDPLSGVRDVATIDALNGLDGDPLGGSLDGCITEDPANTFRREGDYRVSPASKCFEAGIGVLGPSE